MFLFNKYEHGVRQNSKHVDGKMLEGIYPKRNEEKRKENGTQLR